jgi:glycerol-3-phosphate acyltransferase PlsX
LSQDIRIAVDTMGGDFGPRFCVSATLKFLHDHPTISVSLFGPIERLEPLLGDSPFNKRIKIVDAKQVVEMTDKPGSAFRHKRLSSMWLALGSLARNEADACVSGGNTGTLMVMSRQLLGVIDGMDRPAICKPIPTKLGHSFVLDLGANLDCEPNQLLQFAIMGSALAKVSGCACPSVGLLNVGTEASKGSKVIQAAYSLLDQHKGIRFKGFIEGNSLYDGDVDVIVCDGFIGNVALKVSEGAASFILGTLKLEFSSSLWRKFLGLVLRSALRKSLGHFNPSKYNGAALLGLNKVVVKSHGAANEQGFYFALETARRQAEGNIPQKITQCLG